MATVAEIFNSMSYGPAPEAAAPARDWIAAHHGQFDLFIGNRWVAPLSNGEGEGGDRSFETINPASGLPLARVTQGSTADVDAAVRAAREALPAWNATPGHLRARYMYALARQVQKHSRLLAVLETLDNGKPIRETRDIDIPLVARHFAYHAGWAQLMAHELPGYEAVGVVGQIIPWNFPLLMLAWKVAPALAMGNTVVLKPAEFTSLTALAFAEIARDAGLPAGVLNVVTGDGRTGEALVAHPDVDKIAFTGSTEVGRQIRRATAGSGKRLSLELGGKSPFVVFDDADLDSAVEGVVDAIWFNQGQVCCAGSRLLVQESIVETMTAKLRARMERLRLGDPLDKAIDIGAIVAPVQLERIRRLVEQGVAEGATLWQPSWACPRDGYFFPPTLFTGVAPASTVAQVEIFGPVLVQMSFRTPAEAASLANNTAYGLAASVWSENINQALDLARKVRAGTVWINSTNLFDAAAPFGGYRESGYGREGGREGLWEYVRRSPAGDLGSRSHGSDERLRSAQNHAVQQVNGEVQDALRAPSEDNAQEAPAFRPGRGSFADLAAGFSPLSGVDTLPPIDRTPKLYIGGKQARPDSGYSLQVRDPAGALLGEVGEGNRKDMRNAVEAAVGAASGWAGATSYNRAQILYYIAENLQTRTAEFAAHIAAMTGCAREDAVAEVAASIERLFEYGAWADKYDGRVAQSPLRGLVVTVREPMGVIGIVCPDEAPLLGLIALLAPAMAMGNTAIVVPSERYPLVAADLYQVLDTSDVPGGVVNIVTGKRGALAPVLAAHDNVDAVWYVGPQPGIAAVEAASIGNLKRTWTEAPGRDWAAGDEEHELLRQATQIKSIWAPYGA